MMKLIRKKKGLFTVLCFLQLAIFLLFAFTALYFQLQIFTAVQGVIEPLQEVHINADSPSPGQPLIQGFSEIYASYQALISNIIYLLLSWSAIFLFLNGLLWVLLHRMFKSYSVKQSVRQFVNYAGLSLSLLVPFGVIAHNLLQSLIGIHIATDSFTQTVTWLLYGLGVISYFLCVGFLFLPHSWKVLWRKLWEVGVLQFPRVLTILLLSAVIVGGVGYALYYTVMNNLSFGLITLLLILFVAVYVYVKLWWVSSLAKGSA